MGLIYSLGRSNVTLANTTNDIGTIQSGALRSFSIKEAMFVGMSTTSIAIGIGIYRLTTIGVTTGGAMVPTPHNTNAGAFTGTTAVSWTTQSDGGHADQGVRRECQRRHPALGRAARLRDRSPGRRLQRGHRHSTHGGLGFTR
jgi:hypothetical protein